MNEGIAICFETAVVRKDHSQLGGRTHLSRLAPRRATGMRDGNYIPAQRFFRVRSMSGSAKGSQVEQACSPSWGWACFILHSDVEKRALLLRSLRRERGAVDGQGGGKDTRGIRVETSEQNGLLVDEIDALYERFIRGIRFDGKRGSA